MSEQEIIEGNKMKKLGLIITLLIVFLLISCEKREELNTEYGKFTEYIIERNNHYCNGDHIQYLSTSNLYQEFMLDSSCLYDKSYQTSWNKLTGFVSDLSSPKNNSVRVGWRPDGNGMFELSAYYHVNKKLTINKLYTISPNTIGWVECKWSEGYYIVNICGIIDSCKQDNKPQIVFMNYPYFGGDNPAPKIMKVYLK